MPTSPIKPALTDWTEHEPTLRDALHELRCMLRWGLKHWPVVMLLSVLGAGGAGARNYLSPPLFTSTVAIDVHENDSIAEGPPPSAHELTHFIENVVLSDSMLTEVMRALRYDTARLEKTRTLALEQMRDAIGLEFSHDTLGDSDYSSARIGLSFTSTDPEAALAIARALAEHIVTFQGQARINSSEEEKDMALQTEQEVQGRLRESEALLANLRWRYSVANLPEQDQLRPRLRDAEVENEQLQAQINESAARRRHVVLRDTFERDVSGLKYEIVDRGRLAPPKLFTRKQETLGLTALAFFGLFPTLLVTIGGLSFRVYDRDSLRRLGLTCLGHVAVNGVTAGSRQARQAYKPSQ